MTKHLVRPIATASLLIICLLSAAQATTPVLVKGELTFNPAATQKLTSLGIFPHGDLVSYNSWPTTWFPSSDAVASTDLSTLTLSTTARSLDLFGFHGTLGGLTFFADGADLLTGQIQARYNNSHGMYFGEPLLGLLQATSISGGGEVTSTQPVTVTLSGLAASPALMERMLATLGRQGNPVMSNAADITLLKEAMSNFGSLTYTFTAALPAGGATTPFSTGVTVVPEPGTWSLWALGLVGIARVAGLRRRRQA